MHNAVNFYLTTLCSLILSAKVQKKCDIATILYVKNTKVGFKFLFSVYFKCFLGIFCGYNH